MVTITLRTGGQGRPTPVHTQRPTQPPFQHRHLLKKVLKRSFSRFSTRAHVRTDSQMDRPTDRLTNRRTDQQTDQPMDGPTNQRTERRVAEKASYRVACPRLKTIKNNYREKPVDQPELSKCMMQLLWNHKGKSVGEDYWTFAYIKRIGPIILKKQPSE